MPLDIWKLEEYHAEFRQRILADERPGLVQSVIGDVLVSWELDGLAGPTYAYNPSNTWGESVPPNAGRMLDEVILDVVTGEGIATSGSFRRSRIVWMAEDREAYPDNSTWAKKHREARQLREFYLADDAPGAKYLK